MGAAQLQGNKREFRCPIRVLSVLIFPSSYAIQFCLISVFYTISWILFRLFPIILGNQRVELYCFVMIAVSLNNSANAFVYIFFNKEVSSQPCVFWSGWFRFSATFDAVASSLSHTQACRHTRIPTKTLPSKWHRPLISCLPSDKTRDCIVNQHECIFCQNFIRKRFSKTSTIW